MYDSPDDLPPHGPPVSTMRFCKRGGGAAREYGQARNAPRREPPHNVMRLRIIQLIGKGSVEPSGAARNARCFRKQAAHENGRSFCDVRGAPGQATSHSHAAPVSQRTRRHSTTLASTVRCWWLMPAKDPEDQHLLSVGDTDSRSRPVGLLDKGIDTQPVHSLTQSGSDESPEPGAYRWVSPAVRGARARVSFHHSQCVPRQRCVNPSTSRPRRGETFRFAPSPSLFFHLHAADGPIACT